MNNFFFFKIQFCKTMCTRNGIKKIWKGRGKKNNELIPTKKILKQNPWKPSLNVQWKPCLKCTFKLQVIYPSIFTSTVQLIMYNIITKCVNSFLSYKIFLKTLRIHFMFHDYEFSISSHTENQLKYLTLFM